MDRAVQKAAVLIEALPYILEFQGKRVVIKLGGSGMDNEELIGNVLRDIVFMRAVGMHPMIVHGGGPFITRAMEESGAKAVFVHGHRVTDEATLGIVEKVLLHEVNSFLIKQLNSHKGQAAPVHVLIDPFLLAERKKIIDEESGEEVDLGFVAIGHPLFEGGEEVRVVGAAEPPIRGDEKDRSLGALAPLEERVALDVVTQNPREVRDEPRDLLGVRA